jgi:hypothetical protein
VELFCNVLYALRIGFRINSLLAKTRVKSTLYAPILYWSGARHWAVAVNNVTSYIQSFNKVSLFLCSSSI